jgi:hypothetical protein
VNSLKPRSEDAERLGLYTLLADLETEWNAWSKNILLYPIVIGDALCIAKAKVREQISVFESNAAEQTAIDGQLQLNAELDKAVEMKIGA